MQPDNTLFNRLQSALTINCEKQAFCSELCELLRGDSLRHLTLDSRKANQQSIFVALSGQQNKGHDFIESAVENGCKLVLADIVDDNQDLASGTVVKKQRSDKEYLQIFISGLGHKIAGLAEAFYNIQRWPLISAVTGTNGKTSVASLYAQLAAACGGKSASIGTLGVKVYAGESQSSISETNNTTPDILSTYHCINLLIEQQVKHLCLEASSHGLAQKRLESLPISCAIFTNLTQDHLDYHHSMEEYASAKRKLLLMPNVKCAVLNAHDQESLNWQQAAAKELKIAWFGIDQIIPDKLGCWATNISYHQGGSEFLLSSNWGQQRIKLKLIGPFNIQNFLAATTALLMQGFAFNDITNKAAKLNGVAGRMELFTSKRASIIVDYAHTPDALKQALMAARAHVTGKLYCIFGCGGDRDKGKRATMGQIASEYADAVYLTQDNSRSEKAENIVADIKSGISQLNKVLVELDRKKAIVRAWQDSNSQDMILVAGKGHETYIELAGQRLHYDERAFVAELVAQ